MKINRRYETQAEFKARQGRFDFAIVAHAVVEVAVDVVKALSSWWRNVRPLVVQVAMRKPHQLVLELDGIAQMPLFGGQGNGYRNYRG